MTHEVAHVVVVDDPVEPGLYLVSVEYVDGRVVTYTWDLPKITQAVRQVSAAFAALTPQLRRAVEELSVFGRWIAWPAVPTAPVPFKPSARRYGR